MQTYAREPPSYVVAWVRFGREEIFEQFSALSLKILFLPAGNSPFALNDVTSRSAILGVPGKGSKANLYWMKKNPNEGSRKTGNRKRKEV